MSTFRPRFKCQSSDSASIIVERVKEGLANSNKVGFIGSVLLNHIHLKFPQEKRHFWSPHLDISLDELPDNATLIRCLLGPAPGVWTLFVFFYSIFGLGATAGLMVWTSQLTLGKNGWGLWLMVASLIMLGVMHLISIQGKKLARVEMIQMRAYVMELIGKSEPVT